MPNKAISQIPVTSRDLVRYTIEPIVDESGAIVDAQLTAWYVVQDATGAYIGQGERSLVILLTATQKTTLRSFTVNTVLPAINAAEGT